MFSTGSGHNRKCHQSVVSIILDAFRSTKNVTPKAGIKYNPSYLSYLNFLQSIIPFQFLKSLFCKELRRQTYTMEPYSLSKRSSSERASVLPIFLLLAYCFSPSLVSAENLPTSSIHTNASRTCINVTCFIDKIIENIRQPEENNASTVNIDVGMDVTQYNRNLDSLTLRESANQVEEEGGDGPNKVYLRHKIDEKKKLVGNHKTKLNSLDKEREELLLRSKRGGADAGRRQLPGSMSMVSDI